MCIIVDANAIEDMNAPSEHGKIVLRWLLTGRGALIIGGAKLMGELGKSKKLVSTMAILRQAGRLHRLNDAKVDALAADIQKLCCSDDPHVIAVAIESGCRLVFSRDKKLHKDLQNRDLVNPTASIYQTKDHAHLLTECKCKA